MATINAWAKSQPWCDADRVVVWGGSYGGYLVLMAATRQPTLWRAGVDLFGVANLHTMLKSTDQAIRVGFVDEFGDVEKDTALLDEYSPSRDFDKMAFPLFVYAGQKRSARASQRVRPDRRGPARQEHPGRVHGGRERGPLARSSRDEDRVSDAGGAVPRRLDEVTAHPAATFFSVQASSDSGPRAFATRSGSIHARSALRAA